MGLQYTRPSYWVCACVHVRVHVSVSCSHSTKGIPSERVTSVSPQ